MLVPMVGMLTLIVVAPLKDTVTPFLLKPELIHIWSHIIWGHPGKDNNQGGS